MTMTLDKFHTPTKHKYEAKAALIAMDLNNDPNDFWSYKVEKYQNGWIVVAYDELGEAFEL